MALNSEIGEPDLATDIELDYVIVGGGAVGLTERLGGSRSQRDLLELTYVNVLLKIVKTAEARRSLITRRPVLAHSSPLAAFH
jgi:hypothetical protein